MKECKAAPGLGTIEYSEIKEWVYGTYDYASILPFADGPSSVSMPPFSSYEQIPENHTHREHHISYSWIYLLLNNFRFG